MRRFLSTLLVVASSISFSSSVSAGEVINISSVGFMDFSTPHIACTIVNPSRSGERIIILVYAEANRTYNHLTDPVMYIGRPGSPVNSSSSTQDYFRNDDWDKSQASRMISAVGRTPVNDLDSGVIVSAPTGALCMYAYDIDNSNGLGRVNLQFNYLGTSSESATAGQEKGDNGGIRVLSPAEAQQLLNNQENTGMEMRIMPPNSDPVYSTPPSLPLGN